MTNKYVLHLFGIFTCKGDQEFQVKVTALLDSMMMLWPEIRVSISPSHLYVKRRDY